ncbi:MAG TPA: hypothetical protein VK969_10530 [Acidimicrobiia bacterium]|nr:hypothetical protein [Acidimicrobiia bacterium]
MSESETTPRQVLYALVAAGFVVVVAILTIGGASAGLVPFWWSGVLALAIALLGTWMAQNWRRTAAVLIAAIGLFVVWMVGTVLLAA